MVIGRSRIVVKRERNVAIVIERGDRSFLHSKVFVKVLYRKGTIY
jgi:hypothetical protein